MADRRLQRALIGLMLIAFLAVLIGALGEVLGWWNDVGVALMLLGASTASFLAFWSWRNALRASHGEG